MNTNEPNELTPLITQPAATTRRSFIKRTASAAMVATFALGAFENEAHAQAAGGSSKIYPVIFAGSDPMSYGPYCGQGKTWNTVSEPPAALEWQHFLQLKIVPIPETPPQGPPRGGQTVSLKVTLKHLWRLTSDPTLGGMTTIEDTITLTVTNPNFKDEGDISWSSTCAGVTTGEADSFGYFSAFGVQVVATSQADKPRSVSFDVSVIGGLFTHLPSCSWIQNTGSFTVLKPAGTPPPQLDIDPAENLDELFVKPSDGTELGLSLQWTLDFEEVEMKAP